MKLEERKALRPQIQEIAKKYGITQIYIFGSLARGEGDPQSDIDFLIEMQESASMLGVGGFSYEVEKLLGVEVDVIPTSVLKWVDDKDFVYRIQTEAVAL